MQYLLREPFLTHQTLRWSVSNKKEKKKKQPSTGSGKCAFMIITCIHERTEGQFPVSDISIAPT